MGSMASMQRRRLSLGLVGATLLFAVPLGSCQSKAAKQCQVEFQQAQIIVQNGSGTLDGIDAGLRALDEALGDCKTAGHDNEVEQLNLAHAALNRNAETLKSHSAQPKRVKPTPAELDALAKRGDSNCPKGMAYRPEGADREVKCTGLQPVRMNWQKARDYYSKLGFHVVTAKEPPSVRAEHGSELFVFTYTKVEDTEAPRCLAIYPDASIPWQEAVSRATGVPVNKMKAGAPLKTTEGEIALRIDEGKNKLVIYLGTCGA